MICRLAPRAEVGRPPGDAAVIRAQLVDIDPLPFARDVRPVGNQVRLAVAVLEQACFAGHDAGARILFDFGWLSWLASIL